MGTRGKAPGKWGLKAPALIAVLCALVAISLGIAVISGWHLGILSIVQIRPELPAMHYLTAICFLVSGCGLAVHALRLPRLLGFACGVLVGGLGGLLMVEYLSDWHLGFDWLLPYLPQLPGHTPSRPSAPTAAGFVLCGAALLILGTRLTPAVKRLAVWISGSLSLALCLMALAGYAADLSETYVWGNSIGMAFHSAVGMTFLSVGVLATRWMGGHRLVDDRWLPLPVGLGTAAAALILWQALEANRRAGIRSETAVVALDLAEDSLDRISVPLRALERMKGRWQQRGGTPYAEWKADVSAYLQDESVLSAIGRTDVDWRVQWSEASHGASALEGLDLRHDPRWDATAGLEAARQERRMIVSPTLDLGKEGRGFLVCIPLFIGEQGDTFDGFLVASFRLYEFMASTFHEPLLENHVIAIFEGDEQVFGPAAMPAEAAGIATESRIGFHGHAWRFVVAPRGAAFAGGKLSVLVLSLGLLLATALAVAVRGVQLTVWRSRSAEAANRKLQAEVADREKAERELGESEERLGAVLDSATGISVISVDETGLISYFSKGSERLLGYTAAELIGKETPAVFHDPGELAARSRELSEELGHPVAGFDVFVAIPRLQGSERREWTYLCKDGSRRTVDLTVTVLGSATGRITGYLGTALDVTERKEFERELRETLRAKETAQALLEAAGRIARLGHWELFLDGGPPHWSEITYAIHELPPGSPITLEQTFSYLDPKDREAIGRLVQRSIETGEDFEFETLLTTAKGATIWVHSRGEPVKDEQGKVIGLRGVFQDIDERRRARELLEERNRQLEIATARAEAHARAKAEFLANMSHEIRTPLNAVIGMSELLMDARLEAREREFVEMIHTSGDVLLSLINDILDFSKIESDKFDLESIPLQLRDCVESALDLVAEPAARKHLDLAYWIDPAVPAAVMGDPTRLRQVLVNLVANAIKFTNAGEVFVKLSVRGGEAGEPPSLHALVRDSGIGIPADRMDRLFNAFSQVDTSTTRRYGGTGLGLAISHRLIQKMGGRIWVESEVAKGSTFQFEIPLHAIDAPAPPPAPSHGDSLEDLRVLIVDDNRTNRWILQMQIASWGMRPTVVDGARPALARIERGEKFELAILDVMMPEIDGYELAAEIRKHRSESELPILMLTSMGDRHCNAAQLGISGILTKPVKTLPLFNTIRDLLTGHRAARPAAGAEREEKLAGECPLRILVAEDNPVNQRVMTLLLQRMGYQPSVVANGLEVLDALQRSTFQVILLDVEMPEMDGLDAAREICRRYPRRDQRPWMIALTARAVEGDRDECLEAGMDDYVTKPVRRDNLEYALRQAFEQVSPQVG